MFEKILIANRGEIACRIIRTARRMGIATVAVHSDADRNALHVRMADEAVPIGPAAAAESYLVAERIIEAALATGAQAIHPGYGFLSENPGFVEKVEAAGLVFIGPSAASIRAMGLKDAAKRLMEKAGVPVVPGYHGDAQELVVLATKANEIGYPVLIKASAGGGGKGMRKVDRPEDFKDALSAAKRESKAAFGDDRVLVEKFVEKPRHIEVQVFGDSHGNVVHLYERDCSLQRRHQKVIEEAPAPGMTAEMRAAMTDAAVKAAKAIDYRGAGTIEFIVDGSQGLRPDGFWFMEMNTRLQVEHPVTECITGIDLVEWQLRVAAGEPLPRRQDDIQACGHAFEARVYAEDPAKGFLPAIGTLHHLSFPASAGTGALVRVDSGVEEGDAISPFYDPMIAKLVVQGADRASALAGLADALEATRVAGSTANTGFLAALARHSGFAAGDVDTGLIDRDQAVLVAAPQPDARMVAEAALAASGLTPASGSDPWDSLAGFSHFHPLAISVELKRGDETIAARILPSGTRAARVSVGSHPAVTLALGDTSAVQWPGHVTVFSAGHALDFVLRDPFGDADDAGGADKLTAPMPGLVKVVNVEAGATVTKGQPLLVLEAMKMEHTIAAPHDGVIAEVAAQGAQVTDGTVLVRFNEAD
ncbi:3-methylcrotonyl-CoA carboxylase [Zhengella mangrovi]|uniref:3-methylcrotonyl-CoA carboxylase n=1 Tax=Zhengella mangrovi TaxID=1982044 RepID=A0A2G1QS66_9HYPH|nr:acetyl/propionyl/methylcrotonyl-CoA carboxylase subunit alpha [Zhengella mangrovi]PHP68321.1 3-methylcrotonyl-CoA carboxylase [Zhengella mangrovi]